jgi:cell division protein FtsI (penicillin-binding protein 3)/stage V sporulation protein D (sporulation-specific penicillin-binding protein)
MIDVTPKSRIRTVSFVIVLIAGLIIAKLFLLQVVHGENYTELADHQYVTPTNDYFDRGNIFFKDKAGELISAATLKTGFRLAIEPNKIGDAEATYAMLSAHVPLQYDSFIKKTEKINDPYEEIATKVSKDTADKITAEKIAGVSLVKQKWRVYPGEGLAANTLGFVGYKGNEISGRYGVERSYESVLKRSAQSNEVNFFAEVFANIKDTVFTREEKEGDVVLTIEPTVQSELEREVKGIQSAYSAQKVGGIIIDPKTGAIYAMAIAPSFDPNDISQISDIGILGNPLVEGAYEMGSVIKPLVMAAGIDAGAVTPGTTYFDNGSVQIADRTIYNFDKKGRGKATMQDVLNQSLNTGMVFVEQHLGKEKMHDYMFAYGIGEKTGVDLPGEITSLTSNLKTNRDVEFANAAFGQGIALTPIATVRAFSSLANGGVLVTPHVLDHIVYSDGSTYTPTFTTTPTKISNETTDTITNMLITVYDKGLLYGKYKLDHYSIAAKTGTAQVAKENGAGYYDDKHLHSFFGYFPAYNPKFLVFLFALDPKGVNYAAYSLADPFSHVAKFLLDFYNVPPDR